MSYGLLAAAALADAAAAEALIGQHLLGAVGADPVGELGLGAGAEVRLDLAPVAAVIADLLAPGADRQQAGQHLELADRLLDPLVELAGAPPELADPEQRHGDDRQRERQHGE